MRIVVADEISPDSCRLWDIKSADKMDKDRFRRDMGGLIEAYSEVARRLGILTEARIPNPPAQNWCSDPAVGCFPQRNALSGTPSGVPIFLGAARGIPCQTRKP